MKSGSIFGVIDYIKAQRDKETRYEIDTYLLRQGYDAGTIDDAWQIAGLDLKGKSPPFYKWLFLWGIICNFLSWGALFAPWQSAAEKISHPAYYSEFYSVVIEWAINPIWLFLPMALWTMVNIMVVFASAPTITYIKASLVSKFIFISLALVCNLINIAMVFSKLTWQGPVLLTLFLSIAWVCSYIELRYIPKKIEVVLPAHSSK